LLVHRRSRIILLAAAGLILAGAVTNVAVCWVRATTRDSEGQSLNPVLWKDQEARVFWFTTSRFGEECVFVRSMPPLEPDEAPLLRSIEHRPITWLGPLFTDHPPPELGSIVYCLYGWPRVAMSSVIARGGAVKVGVVWRLEQDSMLTAALPTRIHPSGFLINTAVYTAMLSAVTFTFAGLFRGVRFTRKHLRRARGLCTRCGYELAGCPTCPECGTPQAAAGPRPS
jgi:hypothetical protein